MSQDNPLLAGWTAPSGLCDMPFSRARENLEALLRRRSRVSLGRLTRACERSMLMPGESAA